MRYADLKNDPYIHQILEIADDPGIFHKDTKHLKTQLLRKQLKYFLRHNPSYYKPILKNLSINPEKAELSDIVKFAIPSDILRGDFYKKMLAVRESVNNIYHSSGSTGHSPIQVYKSPIDELINVTAIPHYVRHVIGFDPKGGILLMLASEELLESAVLFSQTKKYYEAMGVKIILGMTSDSKIGVTSKMLPKLNLNQIIIQKFFASDIEPKIIFGAPVGLQKLLQYLEETNQVIDLGVNGYINTGGGAKSNSIMDFNKMRQIARHKFHSGGKETIWYDGIGHTEGLMIMLAEAGKAWIPHPLEEVLVIDKNANPIDAGTGMAIHWNPLNTTFLEAFIPGDEYIVSKNNHYYGREFKYSRRLNLGDVLRPGCGAALDVVGIESGDLPQKFKNIRMDEVYELINSAPEIQKKMMRIPTEQKLGAIQAVADLWKKAKFRKSKELIEKLSLSSGYSQETIQFEMNDIPAYMDSQALREVMDISFEKGDSLEPKGPIMIIGSGNTLAPTLYSLLYAWLTNNVCVIRPSQANFIIIEEIISSFEYAIKNASIKLKRDVLKVLKSSCKLIDLTHDHPEYANLLKNAKFNLVHYWGGDSGRQFILNNIKENPNKPETIFNGPLTGITVIDGEFLTANKLSAKIAEELAFNMSIFEQKLCSSPTETYYIGSYEQALKFAKTLAKKLEKYNKIYPHEAGDSAYKLQMIRNLIKSKGASTILIPKSNSAEYTIVVSKSSQSITDMISTKACRVHSQERVKYMEIIVVDSIDTIVKKIKNIPNKVCYEGIDGLSTIGYCMDSLLAKELTAKAFRVVPIEAIFGRSSQEPSDGLFIARSYTKNDSAVNPRMRPGEELAIKGNKIYYFAEHGIEKKVAFFNLVRGKWMKRE